jgi:hypothetical protein
MTPEALARLNEQTNRELVAAVEHLAARAGVSSSLDALRAFRPSVKAPAMSMMQERRILIAALNQISDRLGEERDAPLAVTPPPSRRRVA